MNISEALWTADDRISGKTFHAGSTGVFAALAVLSAEVRRNLVTWSKTPPNESGYWWWWNEDGPPVPVNIEVSLTDGVRYFATQGQHGWNRFQWVEDMGGFWMMLSEPPLPE